MSTLPALVLLSGVLASAAPGLQYSTLIRENFSPKAITTDASGNIYLAGSVPQSAAMVVKLNPQATQYLYVRYLGGLGNDSPNAIAIDASGNLMIAGKAVSPDFPVTTGGNLASPPSADTPRSFVTKLDPSGNVVFSTILGGTATSQALAVAIQSSGQIIVTGTASSEGFPSTPGANTVTSTRNRPYILALNPTGTATTFSATGIGGHALALDSASNIYVAGETSQLDYPTTPGTYQPTLPASLVCFNVSCQIPLQPSNQYVTKLDPSGLNILYSTGVTGKGHTVNSGLAVDATGNVYLTGYAGADYPYTVPVSPLTRSRVFTALSALPFLTKLDPLGQKVLFSVPLGGSGVQVESSGSVYLGGGAGLLQGFDVQSTIPVLANTHPRCLPNLGTIRAIAYVAQADATTGDLKGSQLLGGSSLIFTGSTLVGQSLWLTGTTNAPDFLFTDNALIGFGTSGGYLGAVAFDKPEPRPNAPRISCVTDAADLTPAGPIVRNSLLTIFGTNLGPSVGIGAASRTNNLGGTQVAFSGGFGTMLYASANQINVAVPELNLFTPSSQLRVSSNGVDGEQYAVSVGFSNPKLFLDMSKEPNPFDAFSRIAVALNTDGSLNSASNPAPLGSIISVFANGLQSGQQVATPSLFSQNGWQVLSLTQATPFVSRIELRVPPALLNNFACPSADPGAVCAVIASVYNLATANAGFTAQGFSGTVYVRR